LDEAGGFSLINSNLLNSADRVGNLYKQTFDLRYKDIDIGLGKLSFVLIGNYVKGDTYQSSFSTFDGNVTGIVKTQDMYGLGGGAIWEYDFGNQSMLRFSGLYGHGATDFQGNISNQIGAVNTAWENQVNRRLVGLSNSVHFIGGEPAVAVNPVTNSTEALATGYFVWNPIDQFSLGVWANWEYNDNGTIAVGKDFDGNIRFAGGSRNIVSVGIRPVFWLVDSVAIQGVAGYSYIDNVRTNSGTNAFGQSGQMGIFTIAPTIKAKGGFFTRPEIRVFATYAVWSHSLAGTSASTGQPPYNGRNTDQGWLIGSQMEIWF
jgi:maltoporin